MPLNVTSSDKKNETRVYPYLGVYGEKKENNSLYQVVLFTSPSTGIVLDCTTKKSIGETSSSWNERLYSYFTGSLTLSNA